MFNIADYDKQVRLQQTVENLQQDRITTEGEIIDMKFIIAHQEEKVKQLQTSAIQITELFVFVLESKI